ncbi:uncharacterized protein LOC128626239 isoform X2 [Artibeus jamaicensis]|uniref:uncharacterized protein LOC128626239 isoform X2 n=1 Tax=Artibeus jamaicensis TaxID=9417 RepID=UPI00235B243E|nr:uncharacterized protein LOC128626239 isoform X2 [Artibeus jamaicensis]
MEQGQKIAHFYATQPWLSHDLQEFYWDNYPNKIPRILSKCLQMHGWRCGSDGARVTSRLFSGPCKQSRPMTCSIMPFEEEASSVTMKKNPGVPLLTIGSSSRLQRGRREATEESRGENATLLSWKIKSEHFSEAGCRLPSLWVERKDVSLLILKLLLRRDKKRNKTLNWQ